MTTWEGLNPPYATIVADPPWEHDEGFPINAYRRAGDARSRTRLPYSSMKLGAISDLDVGALAGDAAHLYLWTTNRYLRHAFGIAESWGFKVSQTLVWCKPPVGVGPGGAFASTTEFVVFARSGSLPPRNRADSSWWLWNRGLHSQKPPAFMDLVERTSPGPYVELFARQPRFGWDSWGFGYEAAS